MSAACRKFGFFLCLLLIATGYPASVNSRSAKRLRCEDCHVVTDFLQKGLHGDTQRPEHDFAGDVRPRRRMMYPRSEREIFKAIDGVCHQIAAVSSGKADWFVEPCTALMQQHRNALENHIYSHDVEDLRAFFCNELTDLCRTHQLHDSGEL